MHDDTLSLLGECAAGIQLSVSTIHSILPEIKDRHLRQKLQDGMEDQQLLEKHACALLQQYGGTVKAPAPLRISITKFRNELRLAFRSDDPTAAYLIAEGCDQTVKNISKSQNRCPMAAPDAIRLSQELIRCQEGLSAHLRPYL